MKDQPSLKEFAQALEDLPPEYKAQIAQLSGIQASSEGEVDGVAVKMELVKFVTELHKHNQACDWETNKIKPKNTILTNLSNEIDYNEIKKKLPKNVIPAYDGLTVLI